MPYHQYRGKPQTNHRLGEGDGEALDLELGKDREFTFKCDSSMWVET